MARYEEKKAGRKPSKQEEHAEKVLSSEHQEEIHSEDFQFALKALLDAYRPILEEELALSKDPDKLKKETEDKPPNCDEELNLANRLFEPFVNEKVVKRLLPKEALELLGPIDRWRWCLLHLRCCVIFGWLVCRRQRTFRAFVYYLYQYWICVRRVLGIAPEGRPLTPEERDDFAVLVRAFADGYKPYLTDQLATVEFPEGLPDDVVDGRIDCFEGEEDTAAIFERALTMESAPALLGKAAFEQHSREPYFWLCRCLCLCAIRLGCCLARANSLVDLVRCLLSFRQCTRDCLRPLTCELTDPDGCVEEDIIQKPPVTLFRGIEIKGTATGAFCSHYTLEWREAGTVPWHATGIHYSGNPEPPQGLCGVVNSTLGYLDTLLVPAGPVEIRLCVHSTQAGVSPQCCTTQFELKRNQVWIRGIEGIDAAEPPGVLDTSAHLVDSAGNIRSFGTCLTVSGTALVGGCTGQEIKRYTLSYKPGFEINPLSAGFVQFWQVDYLNPHQTAYGQTNPVDEGALTSFWKRKRVCWPPPFPPGCFTICNTLQGTCWDTENPRSYRVEPIDPPGTPNPPIWNSTPLPLTNCQSGRYTLRLTVEDLGGNIKHDLQWVWMDNKTAGINASKITQIAGVSPCATVDIGQFAVDQGNCGVPWPAPILGIAYDEYIDATDTSSPSDNFGGYRLWIKKDGAPDPGVAIPIPGPGAPPWVGPFAGTSRVGDPAARCPSASPPDPPPLNDVPGVLATFDMRRLDAICNPGEPTLTLKRGECCGYLLRLLVWDTSICPSLSNDRHQQVHHFPVCICNDLPPVGAP